MKKIDPINAPAHYLIMEPTPLDVTEAWKLNFHLGNVIKYIGRAPYKGAELEDLKKARWYLDRHIKNITPDHGDPKDWVWSN